MLITDGVIYHTSQAFLSYVFHSAGRISSGLLGVVGAGVVGSGLGVDGVLGVLGVNDDPGAGIGVLPSSGVIVPVMAVICSPLIVTTKVAAPDFDGLRVNVPPSTDWTVPVLVTVGGETVKV
jgi:hypothetical protein